MKKVGKVFEIVMYIIGAHLTVCAILDVLHITDFIEYRWFDFERFFFVVILIFATLLSSKKN